MTFSSQDIRIGLLSPDSEMAGWFCEDIGCTQEDQCQTTTFSNRQLSFKLVNSESASDTNSQSKSFAKSFAKSFDIFVGIVRFVDVLSLQKMDELLTISGASKSTSALIVIYRNENETDFKMSCPYCGQKLWVRDADQDKRGRCPHCTKGFTLPDQVDHISSSLRLPPSVKVKKIIRQDPGSFAGPLRELIQLASVESSLDNLSIEKNSFSNATMKVNIDDEGNE